MAYEGSCHCGAVTYTVEGDIPDTAMSCNCSHCRRKGFLLTFVPIDRTLVERSLLTDEEIAWWNAYHAKTRAILAPQLEGEALAWLEEACRPL